MRIRQWNTVGASLALLVALVLPTLLNSAQMTVYVMSGLTIIVVTGLSMLIGYAGQVSFGQAAYYAIGAYCAALLSLHGVPTVLALLLAPFASVLVALLIGVPLLRLRGFYLSFATIAVHLIVLGLLSSSAFFGGEVGLYDIPPLNIGGAALTSPLAFAYLTLFLVTLILLVSQRIIESRFGRAFQALSTSEAASESCGVSVYRYKLLVFVLSAAFAGIAGGVYAFFMSYVSPAAFPLLLSFQLVVMSLLGGLRSQAGPVYGTLAITLLVQMLNHLGTLPGMPLSAPAVLSYGAYSALIILVALFLPKGLASVISRMGKPKKAPEALGFERPTCS